MRRALVALLVVALAGVAAVAIAESRTDSVDRLELADDPVEVIATIGPRDRFCQTPITLPGPVFRALLVAAPGAQKRGPIVATLVAVRPDGAAGSRVLATATRPRQVLSGHPEPFTFDRTVPGGRRVALCLRERGRQPIEVWGARPTDGRSTLTTSQGFVNGRDTGGDISAWFPLREPRSVLQRLPAVLRHVSAFKLGGIGPWLPWALLVLVVLAVPAGLARALAAAAKDEE